MNITRKTLLLALLLVLLAGIALAACPSGVTCPVHGVPASFVGTQPGSNGQTLGIYQHPQANPDGSVSQHQIIVECD